MEERRKRAGKLEERTKEQVGCYGTPEKWDNIPFCACTHLENGRPKKTCRFVEVTRLVNLFKIIGLATMI